MIVKEKNGWDRTTLGSKVAEFKSLLSKVEDVYNKVHSLGSNLSAEYKIMMGNHMMTQIAASEIRSRAQSGRIAYLQRNIMDT